MLNLRMNHVNCVQGIYNYVVALIHAWHIIILYSFMIYEYVVLWFLSRY